MHTAGRFIRLLVSATCLVALGANALVAIPALKAERITLESRGDNGPYGKSAYSFRYRSQKLEGHRN